MSERLRIGVVGAAGRLGSRVVRLADAKPDLELVAVLTGSDSEAPRTGVRVASGPSELARAAQVVVDFSAPPACASVAPACAEAATAYVLASTGLDDAARDAVAAAAQHIPVLQAANCSFGVNALLQLVREAAQRLRDFDVEIVELHHGHKRDAPSGTAKALGAAVQQERSELEAVEGRHGLCGPRGADELGYAAVRGGDVAGEHTVYFFGHGERLELTHRATTPDIFADGSLKAARWLHGCPPGLYSMQDVLRA
mgnify:CR=1 FL=1